MVGMRETFSWKLSDIYIQPQTFSDIVRHYQTSYDIIIHFDINSDNSDFPSDIHDYVYSLILFVQ